MILHAGLIARRIGGRWLGALIQGPSGAGKSDLALRAIEAGFRLVADDRVLVFLSDGRLFGRAPNALAGVIEARGVGVLGRGYLPFARIALTVVCVGAPEMVERMPVATPVPLNGVKLPAVSVWPFETSAPTKVAAALEQLGAKTQQGYLPRFAPPDGRDEA